VARAAVLLLEAGRPVSLDRLVDLLWPAAPPASARNTVQAAAKLAVQAGYRPLEARAARVFRGWS
jgi:hypothetical protein